MGRGVPFPWCTNATAADVFTVALTRNTSIPARCWGGKRSDVIPSACSIANRTMGPTTRARPQTTMLWMTVDAALTAVLRGGAA